MSEYLDPMPMRRFRPLALAALVALIAVMAVVLLILLTQAGRDIGGFESYFQALVWFNTAVAVALASLITWLVLKLWTRWRQRKFGSRLLVKLALIFACLGVVPGALIYAVSVQFVSRSIETWFDVRVEGALRAGLNLGVSSINMVGKELRDRVRSLTVQNSRQSAWLSPLQLERWREQLGAREIIVWSADAQVLASAGSAGYTLSPQRPSHRQFQAAKQFTVTSWVTGVDDVPVEGELLATPMAVALVYLPGVSTDLTAQTSFLQVSAGLSEQLVADALNVQQANREYQERALARQGLRSMYLGTLTLALFLTVFGAMVVAALLGSQLVRPLLLLAAGVRDVAQGDLTPKLATQSKDELGGLTRAFADMTGQLADARQAVEVSLSQLEGARASLQTILDSLTAGVLVFDPQRHLTHINPSAERILAQPLLPWLGHKGPHTGAVADWLRDAMAHFDQHIQDQGLGQTSHWQDTFELHLEGDTGPLDGPQSQALVLMARGALLPDQSLLLVFDDITGMISAQRAQAWHEVARRLAHEIKNPLTPIQLSAERLAHKLTGKLGDTEQALLDKSVRTIVQQVDAMQRMVNEFRDFSRLPQAHLRPVALNEQIQDTMAMYEGSATPVQLDLQPRVPLIMADAQQLRQVIHNLVQNAQDACAQEGKAGHVLIQTRTNEAGNQLHLMVCDSGPGFPDHVLRRAFEPYVTTKQKGTGLGLVMVKKIADEHGARVRLRNEVTDGVTTGAVVSLSFPVMGALT
jgi:nitrogen fixation/metabolism regulation signal transduction histidine kinase